MNTHHTTSRGTHTPGPWFLDTSLHIYGTLPPREDPSRDCGMNVRFIEQPHIATAKTYADARLIAAAPDLLAALQAVSNLLYVRPDITQKLRPLMGHAEMQVFEQAQAAIFKAWGEQP